MKERAFNVSVLIVCLLEVLAACVWYIFIGIDTPKSTRESYGQRRHREYRERLIKLKDEYGARPGDILLDPDDSVAVFVDHNARFVKLSEAYTDSIFAELERRNGE